MVQILSVSNEGVFSRRVKPAGVEARPVVCFYWIVPLSCDFSVVIIEQTTEPLPSHDLATCSLIVGWMMR